jgi:hypothetical protein
MTSTVSTHPLYDESIEDWLIMRDCYKGEKQVKSKGQTYLPATGGQVLDGMSVSEDGYKSYESYKKRAVYHNFVHDAVESYIGLLHYRPTQIKLPPEMEFLRTKATINGDNLDHLLRRIHSQQFITGRVGLLLDIDSSGSGNPYIAMYNAENIVNWDEGSDNVGFNALNLVVLDETTWMRQGVSWSEQPRYRFLALGDFNVNEEDYQNATYSQSVMNYSNENPTLESFVTPIYRGQSLNEIPFVFANSKDILATPDVPPLLGLANLSLAIYRAEADYRHTLYMQGQDTLVVVGGISHGQDEATRVGAGARIDVDMGGDAKFIGVSSSGLAEMRQAIENDKQAAVTKAGQLMNGNSKQESGDALKIRMAAQTANLNQVAVTSAYALEELLKKCARWMGLDDSKVEVIPNLQFSDKDMKGQDFAQLIAAKNTGLLPLADKTVHTILKDQGYTKLSYEEERKLMKEDDLSPPIEVPDNSSNGVQQPTASMNVDRVTVNNDPINGD